MNKKWNPGLEQYEIICSRCKNEIIEDEVLWFVKDGKYYCEDCAESIGLKNMSLSDANPHICPDCNWQCTCNDQPCSCCK